MSDAKLVNIARLMTTYNLEIEQLPDDLKCAQCKLVLKDACHGRCCCRYCRACIDDMIERGAEFCPGNSKKCGKSHLSRFVSHYEVNSEISKLAVKCPHDGCVHKCQLANMEEHLRECPRRTEECPFRELGCTEDKLAAEEMGGHLLLENRRHSEILIGVIGNMNKEIKTLKKENKSIKEEKEDLARRVRILSEEISIQTLAGLEQVDAKCVWLIDLDVSKTKFGWGEIFSDYFRGAVHQFSYRLASKNYYIGTDFAALIIQLHVRDASNNEEPFEAMVDITVSDRDTPEARSTISRKFRIKFPEVDYFANLEIFEFLHSELIKAGLNLSRGVCVLCVIVPNAVRDVK